MKGLIGAVIAITTALIILAGYFIPLKPLQEARIFLLGWAVTLVSVAALVGIVSLVSTHWRKLFNRGRERDIYSLFLLVAFFATLVIGLWLSPSDLQFQHVVTSIQVPVETSMMAILAVSLTIGSMRMLQRRHNVMMILFLISVLIFLVFQSGMLSPLTQDPFFRDILHLINRIPLAGARGILIGVALGSLTTGLRILFGADRPYRR